MPPVAEAATGSGGAQTYKVTVTRIRISADGGSTYTDVFNGSQEIDIAAVDAGAVAAGLVTGVSLPPATYDTILPTVSSVIKVKGYVNISGTTFYTNGQTEDGSGNSFSTAAGNDNPPSDSTFAESTFNVGDIPEVPDTGLSIVVGPETKPVVTVKFDTSGVITNDGNGNPTIGEPTVTVSSR